MNAFEITILDFIQNNFRCGFLDAVFVTVSRIGGSILFWTALTLILFIMKKTRPIGFAMAVSLVLNIIICNGILKPLVARVRPYEFNKAVELIISCESDRSFPSGHAAASFAAAVAMCRMHSKWGVPVIVLAGLVALSRLYLYMHYPTDVIAGIVVGIACGIVGTMIAARLWVKLPEKLRGESK